MARLSNRVQVLAILVILLCSTIGNGGARSVHSTGDVDLFPQGEINSADSWYLDDKITFTQESADYTNSMVADNRITFEHARPANHQVVELWSQSSPSDSLYVNGAPDSSYAYTKGPVIEVSDFSADQYDQLVIVSVSIVVAFHIPGPLLQDQVRFTMNNLGQYSELVTYVNTQTAIDYMNGTIWSKDITDESEWSWSELESLVVTMDYVSLGNTDDTQLDVDAVGLSVMVEYPWYGTEWASVESTSSGMEMPIKDVIFSDGTFNNLQISSCGLSPVTEGVEGSWISEILTAEPGQYFGRIHYLADSTATYSIEISTSQDGLVFTDFIQAASNELVDSQFIQIKVTTADSCINKISLDFNDPSLIIDGRVYGTLDGLATQYSRWKVFVNGEEATYQPIEVLGEFNLIIPIGQYMTSGISDLSIRVQSWFNWDSTGAASNTLLEITSFQVSGGFYVEWDEDPVCQTIGPQYFIEDGAGILIPFLDRCVDDRTPAENLAVTFSITQESLIDASLDQDDIKLVVLPDQHGTTTVRVDVTDEAGNIWSETFIVYVEEIDDEPIINEFPSIIPVESETSTSIPFSYYDIDSTGITVTADKSWAVVDLSTSTIIVTPPTTSSTTPVVISVCDQTTCVNQTLLLEVLSLAELSIEEIIVDSVDVREGDVVPVRVYVRNSGNSEAALISIRCQSESTLIAIKSIPMLQSGELGVVTCDWRQTESGSQSMSVELDRVNQIIESDETNNIATVTISVSEPLNQDTSSDAIISTSTLWVFTIIVVALIIVLFTSFAPKKIKKL